MRTAQLHWIHVYRLNYTNNTGSSMADSSEDGKFKKNRNQKEIKMLKYFAKFRLHFIK